MDSEQLLSTIYQALFDRIGEAFPEFGFERSPTGWRATQREFTKSLPGNPRPDRVEVWQQTPWGFKIHGGDFIGWLAYVNGGQWPRGEDYWKSVKTLAQLAGVSMPERNISEELRRDIQTKETRKHLLEVFFEGAHQALLSGTHPNIEKTRQYLVEKRGFKPDQLNSLDVGIYTTVDSVKRSLKEKGFSKEEIENSGLVTDKKGDPATLWEGRLLIAWRDLHGSIGTIVARAPDEESQPKYLYLRGSSKSDLPPIGLSSARNGYTPLSNLLLVEGVIDVLLIQANGYKEVAGLGGAGSVLSSKKFEQLFDSRIESVTLLLDRDTAGEEGTVKALENAYTARKAPHVYVIESALLGDAKDPDEFIRHHQGDIAPLKELMARRIHGLRYIAQHFLDVFKPPAGWDDYSLRQLLDVSLKFDSSIQGSNHALDLKTFFWPALMEDSGLDESAIFKYREELRLKAQQEKEFAEYRRLVHTAAQQLEKKDLKAAKDLLSTGIDQLRARERVLKAEPIKSLAEELDQHEQRLQRWRGSEYIGLPQKTLPLLDNATLGLRGLMLLAAMPNVGKTALSVQLGTDIVLSNPDACFLFVSLEMTRWDILSRIKCRLARIDWKTLVFGHPTAGQVRGRGREVFFTPDEIERLDQAEKALRDIGPRVCVLDERNFPEPNLEKIYYELNALKTRTGAKRAFILVDYLQVWPIPNHLQGSIRSELEADKWRIGAMKTLRDMGEGDPVMVISEARKPSEKMGWASDLADVMGSARGTYTPDIVFLFQPLDNEELATALSMDKRPPANSMQKRKEWDEAMNEKQIKLKAHGTAFSKLIIAKGRDGVLRESIPLTFHFRESRFQEGHETPWVSG